LDAAVRLRWTILAGMLAGCVAGPALAAAAEPPESTPAPQTTPSVQENPSIPQRPSAANGPAVQAEIKASFIYTLAKYVQWPPRMFPSAGAPVVIGVLGDDSLRQALERLASGKRIDGRPILVTSIARPSSLGMCHILFIGVSESARLREALAETRGRSVLTVGESEHFVETGGVLELALVEAMVRFKVNLEVADRDGLRISSKILALGEVLGNSRAGRRP